MGPWHPTWISNQNDFSYFDLQVALILPTKFQVNRPFVSEEVPNRFFKMVAILDFGSDLIDGVGV